jgi:hypothetical protein
MNRVDYVVLQYPAEICVLSLSLLLTAVEEVGKRLR